MITTASLIRRDGTVRLLVAGDASRPGMAFQVRPVVYVMQPDYWLMALVGCVLEEASGTAVKTPFSAEVDVYGSVGRKGIDLTGDPAGTPLRLDLPS
jgi:hypothetical protein